jgi:glycosyltransferase involved in cell wall biosynthesis
VLHQQRIHNRRNLLNHFVDPHWILPTVQLVKQNARMVKLLQCPGLHNVFYTRPDPKLPSQDNGHTLFSMLLASDGNQFKVCEGHMKITWSIPVWGETLSSTRGDIVRARQLITALRNAGHEVHVVARGSGAATGIMVAGYRGVIRRILPQLPALILRDVSRFANSLAFGWRLAKEARKHGSDLIIETQISGAVSGATAARLTGLPLVLDDCSPTSEEEVLGAGLLWLARKILLLQAKASTVVIATSRSVRERLIGEGVEGGKVHIVRNGVNLDQFEAADGNAVRRCLGLSDRCIIGFVGSFLDWHRVDLLVDAFSRVPTGMNAHLLLVGTGPNHAAVMEQSKRIGIGDRVTAVGSVDPSDIPDYLASFDIGVLPDTLDYGNPMKLTEYAAAAVPTVAPDRPSVREVVQANQTGILFPPQDIEAFASALIKLVGNPALRAEMGAQGHLRVAAKSSWPVLANSLIGALDKTGKNAVPLPVDDAPELNAGQNAHVAE